MTTRFHVVVVGAGYAGVTAANRLLATHPEVDVTVVNPRPVFVERVRLHQVAAGSGTATHELTELLHPRAVLQVGTAVQVAPHTVTLADGTELRCDAVVYAVGSGPGTSSIPGREKARPVSDLESATALHEALLTAEAPAPVVVIGGGLTGLETATELAEAWPRHRITLVGDPGAELPETSRRYVRRTLDGMDVEVRTGVKAVRITDDSVLLDDGTELPAAIAVWTAGFSVPELARRSGLPVDADGRLRLRSTLQVVDGTPIVGVGDAVRIEGNDHVRMSCQAAMPLGAHGADTVWDLLQGRAPAPLSLGFVARCISLGRDRGVVQLSGRDDVPVRWGLRGRLAAPVKEAVVRGTIRSMRLQARGVPVPTRRGPAPEASRQEAGVS
ncbi:FAD-dependent oxidoreductase [Rhodococcus sp. Z13]|uniref:FAD-dependent oxidoreductase n=1 Tax=Rhodococcus sacchari TaxID=2962047 RepID=A0ACD4DIR8_9NOCA|nr:FAD-dependent oxidoreductase [Rhodococcus sp. Z13]UYP19855.1 FAD-dependent oxidoreductase [Rhodococcus sp. Z13]